MLDPHACREGVARALTFGAVHQLVSPLQQLARELAGDGPALRHGAHQEAHHADVDFHRLHLEARILRRPVVTFDRVAEPLGDEPGDAVVGKVWNQEAELVPAQTGVQVARPAPARLLRDEVVGPDLLTENRRDTFDDPVPTAWPSASLYHLNAVISTRPTAHHRVRCRARGTIRAAP